jgi:hypothetical protein
VVGVVEAVQGDLRAAQQQEQQQLQPRFQVVLWPVVVVEAAGLGRAWAASQVLASS